MWFGCVRGDVLETYVRAAGVPLVEGLSLERTARPWRLAAQIGTFRRTLRELEIDVVHAHQTHDHWLAALARRGTRARLVRTLHHRRAVHAGPAARWLLGRTDALIASSEGIADRLRAVKAGARVTVVPGAVDAERFSLEVSGAAVRIELGLADAPAAGCVARMVPGRGHDILLRAAARLRERLPEARVVLVGRGEGRPGLERLVRELGLGTTVVFAGYRGADLPAVLAALDCVVFLGMGSEESCRAVLEAMAAGRPVVAAPSAPSRRWSSTGRRAGSSSRRLTPSRRPSRPRSAIGGAHASWERPDAAAWRRTSPRPGARRWWRPSTPGWSPKKRFPAAEPPV